MPPEQSELVFACLESGENAGNRVLHEGKSRVWPPVSIYLLVLHEVYVVPLSGWLELLYTHSPSVLLCGGDRSYSLSRPN